MRLESVGSSRMRSTSASVSFNNGTSSSGVLCNVQQWILGGAQIDRSTRTKKGGLNAAAC